jgi:hypothetical protein
LQRREPSWFTQEFAARPIQYVLIPINTLRTAVIIGATIFPSATVAFLTPSPAIAKPEFSARTGLPCGQCHVNPAGGGKLMAFGQKFNANGYKLKK